MKPNLIAIPQAFYDDHRERNLPSPAIVRTTARHYWIDTTDPQIAELLDDAAYYADPWGPDAGIGLRSSARATAAAIRKGRT